MLLADPKDVTVDTNQWAQFSCKVNCSYARSVGWYIAGHNSAIKRNNTLPGLLIKRSSVKCTPSNERTYFFEVYATEALNKSTFYCAAYEKHNLEKSCSCGTGGDVTAGLPSSQVSLLRMLHKVFFWKSFSSLSIFIYQCLQ